MFSKTNLKLKHIFCQFVSNILQHFLEKLSRISRLFCQKFLINFFKVYHNFQIFFAKVRLVFFVVCLKCVQIENLKNLTSFCYLRFTLTIF